MDIHMDISTEIPVLMLSGTVGVGKSTVLVDIHEILTSARVPHACIDRDALAYSWPVYGAFNQTTAIENIATVWQNFRRVGAERLVIAGVVETPADVDAYRRAIPGARITICQLRAPEVERHARLAAREVDASLAWHLRRTVELQQILDSAPVHEFSVENHARSSRDAACEVLSRVNWLVAAPPAEGTGAVSATEPRFKNMPRGA